MKLNIKFFWPIKQTLFGTTTSRALSFKVLKSELKAEESVLKNAEKRACQAENVVKVLTDFAMAGGGSKGIHRHTVINKKILVRDRLKLLFDSDSPFLEIGLFAGIGMDYGNIPSAGAVTKIGKIHDHYCIVLANDATVKGGTFFPITLAKQIRSQQLSYLNSLPSIYLVDSGGAYLPMQSDIFPDRNHGGRTFYNEAVLSSKGIPQVAVVCGSSTAGGAYCPTMAEEAIIVKRSGVIFLAGPPLVKAATGEIVSEQDLGGADMHCSISGCTDYYAECEEDAFEICRESVLTFGLPQSSNLSFDEPLYSSNDLSIISGKQVITKEDMYVIISRIFDGSMFKEFKGRFGKNLITGFGFLHGRLVGVLANCSSLTFQDAQKGSHFVQLCEKRGIPLIFLQNSGASCEFESDMNDSVMRDRAKMVAIHSCASVPKVVVCIGGCLADDNFTMCGWSFKPNFLLSWPLAHISSRRDIENNILKQDKLLCKIAETTDISNFELLFETNTSAFYHASRMLVDGIILPQNTRQVLALCIDVAALYRYNRTNARKSSLAVLRM